MGAFTSGRYRNLFKEMLSKSDADIQTKLDAAWKQLFYGNDDTQRVYYPVGADMAYVMACCTRWPCCRSAATGRFMHPNSHNDKEL
jgi:hypothetical protein